MVIDVGRRPLILVLLGLVNSLDHLGVHDALADAVRRWMIAAVIAIITYWACRLVKEIVIHYG